MEKVAEKCLLKSSELSWIHFNEEICEFSNILYTFNIHFEYFSMWFQIWVMHLIEIAGVSELECGPAAFPLLAFISPENAVVWQIFEFFGSFPFDIFDIYSIESIANSSCPTSKPLFSFTKNFSRTTGFVCPVSIFGRSRHHSPKISVKLYTLCNFHIR